MSQQQKLEILVVQTREYNRFNTRGTQWKFRLNTPPIFEITPPQYLVSHFVDSMNNLFEYVLEDVGDADMVEIAIHDYLNQRDKHKASVSDGRISYRQMSYGAYLTKCRNLILDSMLSTQ
jgi:hypothetical protein